MTFGLGLITRLLDQKITDLGFQVNLVETLTRILSEDEIQRKIPVDMVLLYSKLFAYCLPVVIPLVQDAFKSAL